MLEGAKESLKQSKLATSKYVEYTNKFRKPMEFQVGQKVWLDSTYIKLPNAEGEMAERTAFASRYLGPYTITHATPNKMAYTLKLPKHQRFHPTQPISRLEPSNESARGVNRVPNRPPISPGPVIMDDGEEEWEVERIEGKRLHRGKIKYYVKWKGFNEIENTWEPQSHLTNAKAAIKDFEGYKSLMSLYLLTGLRYFDQ